MGTHSPCFRACSLVLLLTLLPARASAADDIVLGMSAAFTGTSRGIGIELYRGAQAYFEDVNRQGGIGGRKIRIKALDDGYNPEPAIDNTITLIEKDEVFCLFGYVGTPTVTRILPLLKRFQSSSVFLFCPFTGAEPLRRPPYGDFVFNLRASYFQETAALVEKFVEIGRKRIAVFYQIDAYGRNGWEGVRNALAKRNLRIVEEATYKRGTTFQDSLRAQVDILRSAEPDAVISIGTYGACAAFIRDARDAGWNVPIANVSFVGSESLLNLLQQGGTANGKDYTRFLVNSQVVPSPNDDSLPAVKEYRRLMDSYRPQPPPDVIVQDYQPLPSSFVGLEGFLNAKLIVEVLTRMDKPLEPKRLRATVEAIQDLDLGIGVPVMFGPGQHQGLNKVYFTEVADQKFVPLKDWKKWSQ